jgi:hypothetical protein
MFGWELFCLHLAVYNWWERRAAASGHCNVMFRLQLGARIGKVLGQAR